MNRSASLLAALALTSSAALNLSTAGNASAMTIAWDCFDRTSNALVARSAVDLTSPAISCLQAAGAGATANANTEPAPDTASEPSLDQDPAADIAVDPVADPMGDQGISQEPQPEGPSDGTDPGLASNPSTGDALGIAIGSHLGKLLGQGIADLFNRR